MAHVVCAPCEGCKYTDCVEVCPVDAFREDESMLVIDPDSCIDCSRCVPECPVEAIHSEDDVPDVWRTYVALNAERAAVLPAITEARRPS